MGWIDSKKNVVNEKLTFSKAVAWLFLLASISILFYAYYRSEVVYQNVRSAAYLKYYLVASTGAIFWLVVLRLNQSARANIVTIFISLILGLYSIEIILNNFELIQTKQTKGRFDGMLGEYDMRDKMQVINDLTAKGVYAVPTVHASLLSQNESFDDKNELLPLGGVSGVTTIYCNESGEYIVYQSDRYGFNNLDSKWDAVQIDWVLTGDSFTEGACVPPGKDIASQVGLLTGEIALNLGSSGNGPLVELAVLREYAKDHKPKNIIWLYYEGNDLTTIARGRGDLMRERQHPLLMQYLQKEFSQNLTGMQKKIDNKLLKYIGDMKAQREMQIKEDMASKQRPLISVLFLSNIRKLINIDVYDDINVITNINVDLFPLFTETLSKARDMTKAYNGKLYFVYLPEYKRYSNDMVNHNQHRMKSKIMKIVKELNIPTIDIHQEVFSEHPDPLSLFPLRMSGHYNVDGYTEVAKAIVKGVKEYEKAQ
jgi:hypothetical protein